MTCVGPMPTMLDIGIVIGPGHLPRSSVTTSDREGSRPWDCAPWAPVCETGSMPWIQRPRWTARSKTLLGQLVRPRTERAEEACLHSRSWLPRSNRCVKI